MGSLLCVGASSWRVDVRTPHSPAKSSSWLGCFLSQMGNLQLSLRWPQRLLFLSHRLLQRPEFPRDRQGDSSLPFCPKQKHSQSPYQAAKRRAGCQRETLTVGRSRALRASDCFYSMALFQLLFSFQFSNEKNSNSTSLGVNGECLGAFAGLLNSFLAS